MDNTNSRNLFNELLQSSYSRKFRPAKYKRYTVISVRVGGGEVIGIEHGGQWDVCLRERNEKISMPRAQCGC